MSRKIAFIGIFTGAAVVLLYMDSIMPTGKLTLYFLASLPVAFAVIEFGTGAGIALYFTTCVLSVLVTGNIFGIVPFMLFFGHYPISKYIIERGRQAAAEILLKLAVFNISGLLWYLLFKSLFIAALPPQFTKNSVLLVGFIAALQLVFFIYDYAFSRLLFYYKSRLSIFKSR
ncbi:MAG TPA: hypothetical protein VEB00_05935 [Clostridia bacterium]|nr:hypothetical protein [Clostridia bacterium]